MNDTFISNDNKVIGLILCQEVIGENQMAVLSAGIRLGDIISYYPNENNPHHTNIKIQVMDDSKEFMCPLSYKGINNRIEYIKGLIDPEDVINDPIANLNNDLIRCSQDELKPYFSGYDLEVVYQINNMPQKIYMDLMKKMLISKSDNINH